MAEKKVGIYVKSWGAALITGLARNTVFTVTFICVCVYLFPGGELETVP